ncbi:MAG TPA: hypothetical protein VNN72_05800 [Polyangiaceae bacterium]|nr:hypothetical protein [Polyangiaceae bacterium]
MIEQRDELPEWTDEERSLLASASLDRPPAGSLPRTLHAATAAALASTAAASSAAAVGATGKAGAFLGLAKPLGVVKWLAIVALAGGTAVGVEAWRSGRIGRHDVTAVTAAAPTSGEPGAAVASPSAPPVAPEVPAKAAPTASAGASTAAPTHGTTTRAGVARTEPSAATQPDLTRDIATLDEARRALRAGRPRDALAALNRYDSEAGRSGALRTEAEVLRIEATAQSGDHARAETLARAFLKRNPKSPYAARVRALLPP